MRALQALGTRVATVASEIQRLRAENVALAARVADLEGSGQPSLPMPTVPGGEDLRERIDAFIDAIDHALRLGDGRSMGA